MYRVHSKALQFFHCNSSIVGEGREALAEMMLFVEALAQVALRKEHNIVRLSIGGGQKISECLTSPVLSFRMGNRSAALGVWMVRWYGALSKAARYITFAGVLVRLTFAIFALGHFLACIWYFMLHNATSEHTEEKGLHPCDVLQKKQKRKMTQNISRTHPSRDAIFVSQNLPKTQQESITAHEVLEPL